MKFMIAGAGAMGSRFGLMLHQKGHDVLLIDTWQEHVETINEKGLRVDYNGDKIVEKIPAVLLENIKKTPEKVDWVIVLTKSMALEKMMQGIKSTISENTKVLCLLNGLGHEEILEKYVPHENIFIGNTMWTAGLDGPGEITLFGEGSVTLQNLEPKKEEEARHLVKVLSDAGLNGYYSDNILKAIYAKACVNGTMNGLCTLLEVNMATFGSTSVAKEIVEKIVAEFDAVARKENVVLDLPEVYHKIESCYNVEKIGRHYPSMYQDLIQHHRLTEIDVINGAIVRKGEKYGVPTPYCAFLTQLIHAKEEILV